MFIFYESITVKAWLNEKADRNNGIVNFDERLEAEINKIELEKEEKAKKKAMKEAGHTVEKGSRADTNLLER